MSDEDKTLLDGLIKDLTQAGKFDEVTGDYIGEAMPASFSEKVFRRLLYVLVRSNFNAESLARKTPRGQRMDPRRLNAAACAHVLIEEHRVYQEAAIEAVLAPGADAGEQQALARAYQSIKKDPKKFADLKRRAAGAIVRSIALPLALQRLHNPTRRPIKKRK